MAPPKTCTRRPPVAARIHRHALPPTGTDAGSGVPADAVLYAVVVYGPEQQPIEVRLPFPTAAAADHHARSRGLDGRVVPITFPFPSPRTGT
ncbi:hypothetical protein [Frankia sp. CiP1_Cm_nod1]|uniref:hypothetical protein n=1 Tax=Frankia sp. CiP1_Cm_nod1 TaxID=2897160 RepID=UPI0020257E5A